MSERTLTASMQTSIDAQRVPVALFVYADFPQGEVRLWTGVGDYVWDGNTFTGAGSLLTVGGANETTDYKSSEANVALSGVPSNLLTQVVDYAWQNRSAKIWLGTFDESTDALIADPVLLFGGVMDSDDITDNGETSSIKITVKNRLSDIMRKRPYRYTHEDQSALHPASNDFGLTRLNELQNATIKFGP